jgi:hypothetical protein
VMDLGRFIPPYAAAPSQSGAGGCSVPLKQEGAPLRMEVNLPGGEMRGIRGENFCYHKHRRFIPEQDSKNSID